MALVVDADKCTGCTTCALVCSVVHEGRFSYERSRIRLWRDDARGLFVPLLCEHCEDAPCIAVCPTGALYRDEAGRVLRNAARCIGCSECMNACPLGAISFNPDQKWTKCDACVGVGGIPYCATYCTAQAIRWVPKRLIAREKARETALRRVSAATSEGRE
jgi:anaerobic carbon-monoxide dehydrogenase iron sulfur subunit